MRILLLTLLFLIGRLSAVQAQPSNWPPGSLALLQQAQSQAGYANTARLNPHFYPTSDGRSYILLWYAGKDLPRQWLVSLPGSHGYATRDFSVWHPVLDKRNIGFISLQWWMGGGNQDYYTPAEIYRELDTLMTRLKIEPGNSMLTGFSRGSSNLYAVAAIDRVSGKHYFSTFLASSGGASMNYPPTRDIDSGKSGSTPFEKTNWITACGMNDPYPDRDGCTAMRRTAEWLKRMGGSVLLQIEDAQGGHGALNTNPANAARALEAFLNHR